MDIVVLENLSESRYVFVVCRDKSSTKLFFLRGIRLLRVSSAVEI